MINFTLTRSKRKTVALYVRKEGVEVRAPLRTPKYEIDKFVLSKEKWVINKQAKLAEQVLKRKSFTLTYGSTVTYRGKPCPIVASSGKRADFSDGRFYIPTGLSPEEIKKACVKIYRMLAKRDLTEMTFHFAERMGVKPAAINSSSDTVTNSALVSEIYIAIAIAPLPLATVINQHWQSMGFNYIKTLLAYSFQGILMLVCLFMYRRLLEFGLEDLADATGWDVIFGMALLVGLNILLIISLQKCATVAKSIFGAS